MSQQTIKVPAGATEVIVNTIGSVTTTVAVPDAAVTFTIPTPVPNTPPTSGAGSDITITLPVSSVSLVGRASDSDGVVVKTEWTQVAGGAASITDSSASSTTVTGLKEGSYTFRFTVTDDDGSTSFDETIVTVKPEVVVEPPAPGYALLWQTGYDKLSDIVNEHNQLARGTISTTVFKTGPGSFYSIPDSVSSGTRSEVQYDNTDTPQEGALEWDVRYEVIVPDQCHSLQFHPETAGGSASPGLWHEGGKFVWKNWKSGVNSAYTTNTTIQANKWYHMRLEYKFGSAGYLRFWIDGVKVVDKTNIQVGDGSGQYLKVGFNGWSTSAKNSRIYYDNFQVFKKV